METNDPFNDDRVTATKAAQLLGLHVATVFRWILSGKLPAWKLGRKTMVRVEDLRALFERVKVGEKLKPPIPSNRDRERQRQWTDEVLRRAGIKT